MIFEIPIADFAKMIALIPVFVSPFFVVAWVRTRLKGSYLKNLVAGVYLIAAFSFSAFCQSILSREGIGDARARDLHSTAFTLVVLTECVIAVAVMAILVVRKTPRDQAGEQ
jgi:hypothetical protein